MGTLARVLGLTLFLSVGACGLAVALPEGASWTMPSAYAQSVPEGLSKLEQKANDLHTLIIRVLYVFAGIAIAFCGFKFLQGDPHAWRFTMTAIIGATIIFASAEILQWLQR